MYRAKDTKLKREVALKVLPDAFANDLARMARFQREDRSVEMITSGSRRLVTTDHLRSVHC